MKNKEIKEEYCKEFGYGSFNKYNENDYSKWLEKRILALCIPRVSGSCPIEAIMHYDKLIKTKLERTFEPLRDHGTHAVFCDKINDLREEAKSNYR